MLALDQPDHVPHRDHEASASMAGRSGRAAESEITSAELGVLAGSSRPRDHERERFGHTFRGIALEALKQDLLISIEHDFATREAEMANAEGWTDRGVPMFDPERNSLSRENSFWLKVRSRGETGIVGTCAVRLYADTSLPQIMQNDRLFFDGTKARGPHRAWMENPQANHLFGTFGLIGGGWVRKDFRQRRLAGMLMAYAEAVLVINYGIDYSLGIIHHAAAETGLGVHSYHFNNMHSGLMFDWPGRGTLPMWLLYNHRSDILRQLAHFTGN